jgi:hypothetical protein
MTEVDVCYYPDSALSGYYEDIKLVENTFYIPSNEGLLVYSIDSAGTISFDTSLIHISLGSVAVRDSLLFVYNSLDNDIIVLDISDPARPDSITAYIDIGSWDHFYANDSLLVLAGWAVSRYDITDINDISDIPTIPPIPEPLLGRSGLIDYPFYYNFRLSLNEWEDVAETLIVNCVDLRGEDTLEVNTLRYFSYSWARCRGIDLAVKDSFFFISTGKCRVISFKTNSERDTLIYLDEFEEEYIGDPHMSFLHDTLLILGFQRAKVKVLNIANPSDITKVGDYFDPSKSFHYSFAMKDSFLICNFYHGIQVLKFPCTGCDGNCELRDMPKELEIKTYPNPFNDKCRISIDNNTVFANQSISIYDLKGRKVFEKVLASSNSEIIWNAEDEAKGIYLVVLKGGDRKVTKKIVLMK